KRCWTRSRKGSEARLYQNSLKCVLIAKKSALRRAFPICHLGTILASFFLSFRAKREISCSFAEENTKRFLTRCYGFEMTDKNPSLFSWHAATSLSDSIRS